MSSLDRNRRLASALEAQRLRLDPILESERARLLAERRRAREGLAVAVAWLDVWRELAEEQAALYEGADRALSMVDRGESARAGDFERLMAAFGAHGPERCRACGGSGEVMS